MPKKPVIVSEIHCRVCDTTKPLSEYYVSRKDKLPYKSAYNNECKECACDRVKRNTDPQRTRENSLKRMYGITQAQYDIMLEGQGDKCACCGTTEHQTRWNHFCVDHCHNTGKVRGLLCKSCNIALGEVGDNTHILQSMIEYLQMKVN